MKINQNLKKKKLKLHKPSVKLIKNQERCRIQKNKQNETFKYREKF